MRIINNSVYIGANILQNSTLLNSLVQNSRLMIVTDQTIADLYLGQLLHSLKDFAVDTLVLQASEANKTLPLIEKIIAALVHRQHDRFSTLISLGGGVIGDMTGFAASIYMRGTNWLQVPTTLLAQVDAAVGGKTGFNYLGQKNLLGTFYQPNAVIADVELLQSLPEREYAAGLAEVAKYGMACDVEFFVWLEDHTQQLKKRQQEELQYVVARCCEIKLQLVAADEKDFGARRALNFGHTFAHALESAASFDQYLHGEAVAIGMLLATSLAVKLNLVTKETLVRLYNLLQCLGLPLQWRQELHTISKLRNCMLMDKKKNASQLCLILPCALGEVRVIQGLNLNCLEELIQDYAST